MKKLLKILTLIFTLTLTLSLFTACGSQPVGSSGGSGGDNPAHVHNYETLKFNDTNHWYECSCGEKSGVTAHSGGQATTTEKAVCEGCNQPYGELSDHEHNYVDLKTDATKHWFECECGAKSNMENHGGGQATETEQAVCEGCGQPYGNLLPHTHNYDTVKFDQTNHWYECSCGKTDGEELHKGGQATTTAKAVCSVCSQSYGSVLLFERVDNYVYFGRYPQTIKADNVTLSKYPNENGYYVGSDGAEYLKVIPNDNNYFAILTNGAEILKGEIYYFKLEPIRWRILDEEKGLLVCDFIIDTVQYNHSAFSHSNGSYANNYKESKIRAWLNDEFYKSAFTDEEQESIKITLVDNSAESTLITENNKFTCEDTEDKIFLLSAVEANAMLIDADAYFPAERRLFTSDYSRVTGAYTDSFTNHGCGYWWLRSPFAKSSCKVRFVRDNGRIDNFDVHMDDVGVVPALCIQL